jgi:hypothetical protein
LFPGPWLLPFCSSSSVSFAPLVTTDQETDIRKRGDEGATQALEFAKSVDDFGLELGYWVTRVENPTAIDGPNCTGTSDDWRVEQYSWWYVKDQTFVYCMP